MNTRAFHNFANDKRKKQFICSLQNKQGQWVHKGPELNGLVVNYFTNLFKAGDGQVEEVTSCIERKVIECHNKILTAECGVCS